MKTLFFVLAAGALCPAVLFCQQDGSQKNPPAYSVLRQNEDWSGLAEGYAANKADFFDPIKYVPLDDDGTVWVSFGGQLRERVESWNQFNFGAPANAIHNDWFLLTRVLLHADLHLGTHVRVFLQDKNSFITHRALPGGRRTLDEDDLDLQNGFLELNFPVSDAAKVTLRAGRQELAFGAQRLVSPLDWSNTRRTFDGFTGNLKASGWDTNVFWTRPVVVSKYEFNQNEPHTQFYGVYATRNVPSHHVGVDLYWMKLDRFAATYDGTSGHENRHTLGSRVWGKVYDSRIDYEGEGAYQWGSVGSGQINAFMVSSQLGYNFTHVRTKPRLYAGYDYASGDKQAGGNVETFNQLFPLGHAYFGFIDTVARQNIIDVAGGGSFKPLRKVTASVDLHNFSLANTHDALYNASGAVVRAGNGALSGQVGREADLTSNYQYDRHTLIVLGYCHLFPGQFIKASGPHQPVDFAYSSFQYTF